MTLKNSNPVMITVPQATRDAYNQIAERTGEKQFEVAARLAKEEQQRLARRQQRKEAGRG